MISVTVSWILSKFCIHYWPASNPILHENYTFFYIFYVIEKE